VSRHTILNIVLAVIAATLVGAVIYLDNVNDNPAASGTLTTATTSTTLAASTTDSTMIPTTTIAPTDPPTTAAPATEAPTTVPPPTEPPPTEPPTTLPPTTLPPPERALVPVVVTSAGSSGERVGPTVYLLSLGGWTDIRGVNGAVPAPFTIVYYVDGFQNAAEQMAVDMSLPLTSVAPLASAPPVSGLGNAALVVYLGG
jgi:hypothetical protein